MVQDTATASVLFGMESLQVTDGAPAADGTLEVWAVTDHPAAATCSDCGTAVGRVHETALARPRDMYTWSTEQGRDPGAYFARVPTAEKETNALLVDVPQVGVASIGAG